MGLIVALSPGAELGERERFLSNGVAFLQRVEHAGLRGRIAWSAHAEVGCGLPK
jgi:hypothetical protein